ncbi:MAG: hypothetical protein ABL912_13660 [Novosphingobium sp.]
MAKYKQIGIDVEVSRAIEANRLSFSETENDILRRMVTGLKPNRSVSPKLSPPVLPQGTRNRGVWSLAVQEEKSAAANLTAAYQTMLLKLAAKDSSFLEKFSTRRARSRLFVSKRPEALYGNSPHLAADFAKPLTDGWYFDTNLSLQQIAQRARAAAEVAGLRYGVDLYIAKDGQVI